MSHLCQHMPLAARPLQLNTSHLSIVHFMLASRHAIAVIAQCIRSGGTHAELQSDTRPPLDTQGWRWAAARGNMVQPGSAFSQRFFARHPMVLQIGSTVFVHAGLHPDHIELGLDALNDRTQVRLPAGRCQVLVFNSNARSGPAWQGVSTLRRHFGYCTHT